MEYSDKPINFFQNDGLSKEKGAEIVPVSICIGVRDDCKNLMESYGEICVQCNKCGRFDTHSKTAAFVN